MSNPAKPRAISTGERPMIQEVMSYRTSDGSLFLNLHDAHKHEAITKITAVILEYATVNRTMMASEFALLLVQNPVEVVEALRALAEWEKDDNAEAVP